MAESGFCPSGRFFEAAACGTPIISDWFEGLDHFFTEGEEIFISRSARDTLMALDSPLDQLQTMASRARERTLDENTGRHRAEQLLQYCDEARASRPSRTDWDVSEITEKVREVA
jgi:spore maturation protein CgeB